MFCRLRCFAIYRARTICRERRAIRRPFRFPSKMGRRDPLPHLFVNDYSAYLTFYVAQRDPNWDGSYVKVDKTSANTPAMVAYLSAQMRLPISTCARHYIIRLRTDFRRDRPNDFLREFGILLLLSLQIQNAIDGFHFLRIAKYIFFH